MKIPIIRKGEYNIRSMRMRQYICHIDHNLWDVIVNGDLEEESALTGEIFSAPAPKTAKQLAAKRNQERIAKSPLEAIKSRFGGNEESKKKQKNVLKHHQFENFSTASNESLDKAYERFQKLISQLEVHGAPISKEEYNQKFPKKVYEEEMKRSSSSTFTSQNLAFLSFQNTSSTNEVSTASGDFGVSSAGGISQVSSTPCAHDVACSFFCTTTTSPHIENEDFQQIDEDTGRKWISKKMTYFHLINPKIEAIPLTSQLCFNGNLFSSSSSSSDNEIYDEESTPANDRFSKQQMVFHVVPLLNSETSYPRADISFASDHSWLKNVKANPGDLITGDQTVVECDNGTEFKNHAMNEFCAKKGIKREFSVARTPQQNGVAERKNRTLIKAARTMIEAIRLFLAFASYMGFTVYQMDVKSAFLYGTIEGEVYVYQPPGFVDPAHAKKSIRRGTINKKLFITKNKSDIMLVQVYVDDIIFSSTKKSMCTEFEDCMHKRFQMSSMGKLTFFLGLQVKQQPYGIFISQGMYVADILKKFDYWSIRTASTPIESNKPLVKDEDGKDVDVHVYRSMIGSLAYLTTSRPDIKFVVCAYARF
ncbi:putative ribonuclease H-like domain-containing protein [Tanacetum coccineum]